MNNSKNFQDADIIGKILKRLEEIEISYDDLSVIFNSNYQNTKIGKTLKKLTKHKDQIVSKLADKLIDKWKKVVQLKNSQQTEKEKETKNGEKEKQKPKEKISVDNKNTFDKKENNHGRAATPSLGKFKIFIFQKFSISRIFKKNK